MREQVRVGTFETNSSSVHCMTMCTNSDYEKWQNGELLFDTDSECLISKEEAKSLLEGENYYDESDFLTYDEFWGGALDYETFSQEFNGVTAFGYFGYD
jgi:hypothetical protein